MKLNEAEFWMNVPLWLKYWLYVSRGFDIEEKFCVRADKADHWYPFKGGGMTLGLHQSILSHSVGK